MVRHVILSCDVPCDASCDMSCILHNYDFQSNDNGYFPIADGGWNINKIIYIIVLVDNVALLTNGYKEGRAR